MSRDELLRITRKRIYAALATSSPSGWPEAATLRYAVSDSFELVFGTLGTSRKIANLRHNPKAAVLIWDSQYSIQIEGIADEPSGAELARLKQVFAKEYPADFRFRESRPNHLFFRVTPSWLRYGDFTDEPAKVTTVDFVAGTETQSDWPP